MNWNVLQLAQKGHQSRCQIQVSLLGNSLWDATMKKTLSQVATHPLQMAEAPKRGPLEINSVYPCWKMWFFKFLDLNGLGIWDSTYVGMCALFLVVCIHFWTYPSSFSKWIVTTIWKESVFNDSVAALILSELYLETDQQSAFPSSLQSSQNHLVLLPPLEYPPNHYFDILFKQECFEPSSSALPVALQDNISGDCDKTQFMWNPWHLSKACLHNPFNPKMSSPQ